MPQQHKGLTHPGGGRAAPGQDERYFAQHPGVVSLRTLPAPQHDVLAFLAVVPQQPFASAQQAAPDLQQACAPEQHDLTWAQQSLPWAQQPSLAGATQQARSLAQQDSFLAQQSDEAAFWSAPAGPATNNPNDRTRAVNRFVNMIFSTKMRSEVPGTARAWVRWSPQWARTDTTSGFADGRPGALNSARRSGEYARRNWRG